MPLELLIQFQRWELGLSISCQLTYILIKLVEEVSMKWMNKPSVTEMEKGGVYEMDRRKSAKNMEMPLKYIKFNNTF